MRNLENLSFDNRFARLADNYHSRVTPSPLGQPYLVSFNPDAAALLDLDPAAAQRREFLEYFSGNRLLPGAEPVATVYAGHQFGVYVPQLGDGRAMLLGEVRNAQGASWDVQLKGAGKTPYSRFADGRAVLRSSIREYLCGEAMHALGIPSTRALCIVGSDDPVERETVETAAVLTRLAPTHIRFGHFEYFYYRQQFDRLAPLADYVIGEHFPQLAQQPAATRYRNWLAEVIARTAQLIARWQAVGFCHGVMNSDNMSIVGVTLDYGPYGFMDAFDFGHICNHSDEGGRYAYNQQPAIAHWNLSCLVQACLPLLAEPPEAAVEIGTALLKDFPAQFEAEFLTLLRAKFGLLGAQDEDPALMEGFLSLLHANHADFTRSFRALAALDVAADAPCAVLRDEFTDRAALDAWASDYRARLRQQGGDDAIRATEMRRVNPKYVLRNYLVQAAIEQAQHKNYAEIETLRKLLACPYDEQPELERYAQHPPEWAGGISVSCSS
ncbi:MAG: protein adenylyltransferase SelO [Nevskiales bacterium]